MYIYFKNFKNFFFDYLFHFNFFFLGFLIGLSVFLLQNLSINFFLDYKQGPFFFMFFFHVPFAYLATFFLFLNIFFIIIINFSFSNILFNIIINCFKIGLYTIILALITGIFWSYISWGRFLAFEPKFIGLCILFFFYIIINILIAIKLYFRKELIKLLSFSLLIYILVFFYIKYNIFDSYKMHQDENMSFFFLNFDFLLFFYLIIYFCLILIFYYQFFYIWYFILRIKIRICFFN